MTGIRNAMTVRSTSPAKTFPKSLKENEMTLAISSINSSIPTKAFMGFEKLKNFFQIQTGISIIEIRPELHFHIYEPNDYFGIHDDNMDSRVFSVGVLLNDNFTGGDFILYPNDKSITLDKSAGNSYIFPVNIKHEVTKIIKGERYSLIWFLKNTNIKSNSKSLI